MWERSTRRCSRVCGSATRWCRAALLPAFVSARYLIDRQPPSLYQTVAAEFLREGHFAAHIRRMRAALSRAARCAGGNTDCAARRVISTSTVPDQGMHLDRLPARTAPRTSQIEASDAMRAGIVVRAMSRFYRRASRSRR